MPFFTVVCRFHFFKSQIAPLWKRAHDFTNVWLMIFIASGSQSISQCTRRPFAHVFSEYTGCETKCFSRVSHIIAFFESSTACARPLMFLCSIEIRKKLSHTFNMNISSYYTVKLCEINLHSERDGKRHGQGLARSNGAKLARGRAYFAHVISCTSVNKIVN